MTSNLHFAIQGQNVSPATVALDDLLETLGDLKSAITKTALDAGARKSEILLSLVAIKEGSSVYEFQESPASHQATLRVAAAVRDRDLSLIPSAAREALKKLYKRSRQRNWTMALSNGQLLAEIRPNDAPPSFHTMTGSTSLFACVLRVGGSNRPTACVRTVDEVCKTFPITNKEVARQLAAKLYEHAVLEGTAKWYSSTGKLADFRIESIGRYTDSPEAQAEAFSALREISRGVWDDIDPEQYVREQRAEGLE